MAWIRRQYSKGQIDRAGLVIRHLYAPPAGLPFPPNADNVDEALRIINNWRSAHSYPLLAVKTTLRKRARKIDPHCLIAQRLKRMPSIALKLEHNPHMQLSQMQDIGGCRAVVRSISELKRLIRVYQVSKIKNPRTGRPIEVEPYDYIQHPKEDGYRSYHSIFKYQTKYKDLKDFEGQRIEIQMRSQLQHAWATAVETVQTFSGQALKSRIKAAEPEWLRFFVLMGSVIAARERSPLVPNTPEKPKELADEIRELAGRLNVEHLLLAWGGAVERIVAVSRNSDFFLLELEPEKKSTAITGYRADELPLATEAYIKLEKERPDVQAVLVAVDSIEALRAAYPNYYLDTSQFLGVMQQAISPDRA